MTTNTHYLTRYRRKREECVICTLPIEGKSVRTPCGHSYDVACLLDLVQAATRDESLFPPTCCSHTIPSALFEAHMSPALASLFAEKTLEYATPSRVYCAKASCSRFLGARIAQGDRSYTCGSCGTRTCTRCRCEMKRSGSITSKLHTCRPDTTAKLLIESRMGREAGWARCPGCERVVELHPESGCYTVICRCKTGFCAKCGAHERMCSCQSWDKRPREADGESVRERGQLAAMHTHTPSTSSSLPPPPRPEYLVQPLPPVPVLPPGARHGRTRETWIHKPAPPVDESGQGQNERGIMSFASRRHERASAPAELQRRVPHEDILARGVDAQERRRRRSEPEKPTKSAGVEAEKPCPAATSTKHSARGQEPLDVATAGEYEVEREESRESWARTRNTESYNGRMDALEEQINRLLQVVEQHPVAR